MLLLERGAQPQLADAEGRYSASFSVESSVRKVCVELKIQCVSTNVLLRAAVISYGEFNEEQCHQTQWLGELKWAGMGRDFLFLTVDLYLQKRFLGSFNQRTIKSCL